MALICLIVTSGIHVDSTWSVREFGIPKIWRSVEFGIPKIWRSVTFTIIVFDSKYFETVVSILNSFSSYVEPAVNNSAFKTYFRPNQVPPQMIVRWPFEIQRATQVRLSCGDPEVMHAVIQRPFGEKVVHRF
jgi:hypothetical protein